MVQDMGNTSVAPQVLAFVAFLISAVLSAADAAVPCQNSRADAGPERCLRQRFTRDPVRITAIIHTVTSIIHTITASKGEVTSM